MSTHNICFRREIRKILCGYPLLSVAMSKVASGNKEHAKTKKIRDLDTCKVMQKNTVLSEIFGNSINVHKTLKT